MKAKELLFKLVNASSESEVSKIIDAHPILSNEENWRPYGGFRNNSGQIDNQQGNTIPALVEKPINSIDAILIKECKLKGIDPESPQAPQTIPEAVEQFLSIKNGDFSEITEKRRRAFAEDIQIIADGSRKMPNISIYDNGEGQHPADFERTFLSLNRENKNKIRFVQGKFNMGGTGVLPNCGKKKYQLLLSKTDALLLDGKPDLYGFSLVRLHQVSTVDQYKSDWYEYCVDADGNIFSFAADELDIGLYNRKFSTGTFIKLFNYDLPHPSDITLDLWRDLNRYLYAPALPILLYEKRQYKGHTPTKLLLGNRMRVMIDDREMKETSFPLSLTFCNIKFPGEITVFKDYVDKQEFIDKLAVVFTVNGQVHEFLSNSFITHSAKLTYLSGYLLVNINCSNVPPSIWRDLFMSSRDRMRDTSVSRQLKDEISRELNDHDTLREINERRRDAKIYQSPKDEEFIAKVMSRLLRSDDEIAKILGLNGTIVGDLRKTLQKKIERQNKESVFKPKRFPTYVKFKKIAPGNIKMLPAGGECKLRLETDAEDEYLLRPKDKGELKISFFIPTIRRGKRLVGPGDSDEEPFDVNVVGPNQGEIKIRLKDKMKFPVGTPVPVNIELSSPEGPHTLTAIVKIDNPLKKAKSRSVDTRETHSLPKCIEVYRQRKENLNGARTWDDPDYKWCGEDICRVFPSGDDKTLLDAVAVNMDADVMHNYIRREKLKDKNIEHVKRLYKVAIYLISLILYFQLSKREEIEDKEGILSYLMKGVGKIVLQVAVNQEIIKEVEHDYS